MRIQSSLLLFTLLAGVFILFARDRLNGLDAGTQFCCLVLSRCAYLTIYVILINKGRRVGLGLSMIGHRSTSVSVGYQILDVTMVVFLFYAPILLYGRHKPFNLLSVVIYYLINEIFCRTAVPVSGQWDAGRDEMEAPNTNPLAPSTASGERTEPQTAEAGDEDTTLSTGGETDATTEGGATTEGAGEDEYQSTPTTMEGDNSTQATTGETSGEGRSGERSTTGQDDHTIVTTEKSGEREPTTGAEDGGDDGEAYSTSQVSPSTDNSTTDQPTVGGEGGDEEITTTVGEMRSTESGEEHSTITEHISTDETDTTAETTTPGWSGEATSYPDTTWSESGDETSNPDTTWVETFGQDDSAGVSLSQAGPYDEGPSGGGQTVVAVIISFIGLGLCVFIVYMAVDRLKEYRRRRDYRMVSSR